MVGDGGEEDDLLGLAAAGERMEMCSTEGVHVQPRPRTPRRPLCVQRRVVQTEPVHEEDAAVDVDVRKRKTPGSQPRGATGYTRGGECSQYLADQVCSQEDAAHVNFLGAAVNPPQRHGVV